MATTAREMPVYTGKITVSKLPAGLAKNQDALIYLAGHEAVALQKAPEERTTPTKAQIPERKHAAAENSVTINNLVF